MTSANIAVTITLDKKFISLSDGTTIRVNAVTAIRPLKAITDTPITDRIVIDYLIGSSGNCVVLECSSWEETVIKALELQKLLIGKVR